MTIYPFTIHLGSFAITGFGLMMMFAFLVAGWIMRVDLKDRGLNEHYSGDIVVAAVIGGIIGAKLWYWAMNGGSLFSRGGLVWYGGFLGGAAAVILNGWRKRVPLRWTFQIAAPSLAAAYALGRIGCFIVNDDYGRPTNLPWGVKFPQGLPPSTAENMTSLFSIPVPPGTDPQTVLAVHPTQLYEVVIMLAVFALLWRWRLKDKPVGWLFGVYLLFAGVERFVIEFLRAKDDRLLGPLTVAQVVSMVLIVVAASLIAKYSHSPSPDPGPYLSQTRD